MKANKLASILALFFPFVLVFLFCCGGDDDDDESEEGGCCYWHAPDLFLEGAIAAREKSVDNEEQCIEIAESLDAYCYEYVPEPCSDSTIPDWWFEECPD